MKERLIAMFGNERIIYPSQPLCVVKHTGSIEEYVHLFEDLSSQVSGFYERQLEGIRSTLVGYSNTFKSSSEPSSLTRWKMKIFITYITPSSYRPLLKGLPRPQQKLSKVELDEKRRLGLCYKCDDKWSKTHLCQNQSLQVLTLVNGYEIEVIDDTR